VIATSLDGRISIENGSNVNLGSKGDRQALEEALAWADATIMGGGTLRTHQNTCLIHQKELIKQRLSAGKSKQPISLIVSNSKHSEDWIYFQQPIRRILISGQKKPKVFGYESIIQIKRHWKETLAELPQQGITKIVLLGGAKLIGSFFLDEVIDELQLTFTPQIIGGECTWLPTSLKNDQIKLNDENHWILKESKSLGNDEFLLRYFRTKNRFQLKNNL
tara:strand:+ start:13975 stop:14634 length:660 start_codon:yes stop_codon:yes gene_type:complete